MKSDIIYHHLMNILEPYRNWLIVDSIPEEQELTMYLDSDNKFHIQVKDCKLDFDFSNYNFSYLLHELTHLIFTKPENIFKYNAGVPLGGISTYINWTQTLEKNLFGKSIEISRSFETDDDKYKFIHRLAGVFVEIRCTAIQNKVTYALRGDGDLLKYCYRWEDELTPFLDEISFKYPHIKKDTIPKQLQHLNSALEVIKHYENLYTFDIWNERINKRLQYMDAEIKMRGKNCNLYNDCTKLDLCVN